jgi:hypothetical protein
LSGIRGSREEKKKEVENENEIRLREGGEKQRR